MARSILGFTFDEIADDDVNPFSGWGDEVTVEEIRPTFDLHDPMVVEPGLINIALDYGWMRASDVVDVPEMTRQQARDLSDRIIMLRVQNWILGHSANGLTSRDPHRSFGYFLMRGQPAPKTIESTQPVPSPEAVEQIRQNCIAIRDAIKARDTIGAPVPATRTNWITQWEILTGPSRSNTPWDRVVTPIRTVDAAPPPAI
jgi:hypothetical protein